MTAPGQPIPYSVLENANGFYYRGYGQTWIGHLHRASTLSETLAEKLQKRYPGSTVEREVAYDVNLKESFADVGEPEAVAAIAHAIRLAKADGLNLPSIQMQQATTASEFDSVSSRIVVESIQQRQNTYGPVSTILQKTAISAASTVKTIVETGLQPRLSLFIQIGDSVGQESSKDSMRLQTGTIRQ